MKIIKIINWLLSFAEDYVEHGRHVADWGKKIHGVLTSVCRIASLIVNFLCFFMLMYFEPAG